MTRILSSIVMLALCFLQGCRTQSRSTEALVKSAALPLTAPQCSQGTYHGLILAASEERLPGFTELNVPQFLDPSQIPGVITPRPQKTIRLDLCVTSQKVKLDKLNLWSNETLRVIIPTSEDKISGLDVLYDRDDYSQLDIVLTLSPDSQFIVRGHNHHRGAYYAEIERKADTVSLKAAGEPIIFGRFESITDPHASFDPCLRVGGVALTKMFSLDAVSFRLLTCRDPSSGKILSVEHATISDASVLLDRSNRGRTFELSLPQITWQIAPDDSCRQLVMALPHATYSLYAANGTKSACVFSTQALREGYFYLFQYGRSGKVIRGKASGMDFRF